MNEDDRIRESLREAHSAHPAPALTHLVTRARARAAVDAARPRRLQKAATVAGALLIGCATLVLSRSGTYAPPHVADPLANWKPPTDFLLRIPPAHAPVTDSLADVPGAEFLRTAPSVGTKKPL